jgi:hypothetical protein
MRVINYQKIFNCLSINKPKHAVFSASASDKWLECTAYFHTTKDLPPTKSGAAAIRGTDAHSVLEQCLLQSKEPSEVTNDVELADMVGYATDFVKAYQVLHPNSKLFSEIYLPWYSVSGGTIDILGVEPGEILIADLKTGRQFVDVKNNTQLLTYAVAARKHLGHKAKYRLVIIQPGMEEPVREWVVSDKDLNVFEEQAVEAMFNNLVGGEFKAGDHCKWCRASAVCEARANFALGQIELDLRKDFLEPL